MIVMPGIQIMEQESDVPLDGDFPVVVPYFMKQIIEEISRSARKSRYIDQTSGVSADSALPTIRR
jgi:magnesium chelatase subunit I